MRTLATGARAREAGFTLVEVMVVLTIIGLVAGLALIAAPPPGPSVTLEAERFGARLKRAQEEAVLTNRQVDVDVDASGYAFRVRERAGWRPLVDRPFGKVAWEEKTQAWNEGGEGSVSFEPAGGSSAGAFVLTRGDKSVRVKVDTAGNVRVDAAQRG